MTKQKKPNGPYRHHRVCWWWGRGEVSLAHTLQWADRMQLEEQNSESDWFRPSMRLMKKEERLRKEGKKLNPFKKRRKRKREREERERESTGYLEGLRRILRISSWWCPPHTNTWPPSRSSQCCHVRCVRDSHKAADGPSDWTTDVHQVRELMKKKKETHTQKKKREKSVEVCRKKR